MPPTRGASRMWKIDGGFPCYVVFSGYAFEVKVKVQLGHWSSIRGVREVLAIRPPRSVVRKARYVFQSPASESVALLGAWMFSRHCSAMP